MFSFVLSMLASVGLASEPNPPNWDTNKVFVMIPGSSTAQSTINRVLAEMGGNNPEFHGQFSNSRYAFLFEAGVHNLNVEIGFYTTVHGVGRTPSDTTLANLMTQQGGSSALCNFWRSAENVRMAPASGTSMLWAVSQACPLRRVQVDGDLQVSQNGGWSSGGYMADMKISGTFNTGTQQQWFTRNSDLGWNSGGNWNMVYVGTTGAEWEHCSNNGANPVSNIASTPVIQEKPYIIDIGWNWKLMRPKLEHNKVGHTANWQNADEIDFSQVYVAKDTDSAATINSKLSQGLHLVLQPGIYHLDQPLKVTHANTVVFGMGMATLIPTNGTAAIEVDNVDGVRIAGVLLEAGWGWSDSLLVFGQPGYQGSATNPGSLHDVFARVGGTNGSGSTYADKMLTINTANTIIDGVWLWRADHDVQGLVYDSRNHVTTGLLVNGDNVTGYGLAVEHTLGDMLVWNGNGGRSYFYQAEYPYDVTQANYGDKGYAAYKVGANVTSHHAYGVGVYSYFRDNWVTVGAGIKAPSRSGVYFHNSLSVFLNGNGAINHVINDQGSASQQGNGVHYVCEYGSNGLEFLQ